MSDVTQEIVEKYANKGELDAIKFSNKKENEELFKKLGKLTEENKELQAELQEAKNKFTSYFYLILAFNILEAALIIILR